MGGRRSRGLRPPALVVPQTGPAGAGEVPRDVAAVRERPGPDPEVRRGRNDLVHLRRGGRARCRVVAASRARDGRPRGVRRSAAGRVLAVRAAALSVARERAGAVAAVREGPGAHAQVLRRGDGVPARHRGVRVRLGPVRSTGRAVAFDVRRRCGADRVRGDSPSGVDPRRRATRRGRRGVRAAVHGRHRVRLDARAIHGVGGGRGARPRPRAAAPARRRGDRRGGRGSGSRGDQRNCPAPARGRRAGGPGGARGCRGGTGRARGGGRGARRSGRGRAVLPGPEDAALVDGGRRVLHRRFADPAHALLRGLGAAAPGHGVRGAGALALGHSGGGVPAVVAPGRVLHPLPVPGVGAGPARVPTGARVRPVGIRGHVRAVLAVCVGPVRRNAPLTVRPRSPVGRIAHTRRPVAFLGPPVIPTTTVIIPPLPSGPVTPAALAVALGVAALTIAPRRFVVCAVLILRRHSSSRRGHAVKEVNRPEQQKGGPLKREQRCVRRIPAPHLLPGAQRG